jgi:hypothetical protein
LIEKNEKNHLKMTLKNETRYHSHDGKPTQACADSHFTAFGGAIVPPYKHQTLAVELCQHLQNV